MADNKHRGGSKADGHPTKSGPTGSPRDQKTAAGGRPTASYDRTFQTNRRIRERNAEAMRRFKDV
jgi:hypothetical protein